MKLSHFIAKTLITSLFLFLANLAASQNLKLELAKDHMDVYQFGKAVEICLNVLEKHPQNYDAIKNAAICYSKLQKTVPAEQMLQTLDSLKLSQKEDLLLLANALKSNKKYDEALKVYKKYSTLYPGNEIVQAYVNNEDWAFKINRDSTLFAITNMKTNSEYSDFAPCYYERSILFSSSRKKTGTRTREYNWNEQSYLNLYKAELTLDSTMVRAEVLESDINSRYHEGTVSYHRVDRTLFVTRNNFLKGTKKKDEEGYLNLAIYSTRDFNGEFEDLTPMPFNSKEYSVGHPSISSDGLTLYFSSDMNGGHGGTDIYKVEWIDGQWGEPINLGAKVNTSSDEMFPFIHKFGVLYFSSNGHVGLGGMDIHSFNTTIESSLVENAGYPLNSPYDDFSIIFNEKAKSGFFSSNRPGGIGDDDIYKFYISKPKFITISGMVIDEETNYPINEATLYLTDPQSPSKLEIVATTNEKGEYTFTAPYQDVYDLKASKKGYFEDVKTVASNPTTSYIDNLSFKLSKYDYLAKGNVLLADDNTPIAGATITLTDEEGAVVGTKISGNDGYYSFGLYANKVYRVTCELAGHALQSVNCDTRNRKSTVFEHDFKMFKLEVGVTVQLDNIYYDYAKASIRPDAALELDKLVSILEENPSMKIELSSHTDARGSAPYNLNLSKRRATSAVDYIISKGTSSDRIQSKGYGESKPLNSCVDGVNCSEEEYQINRRTEFTITDI